jgi:transposase
LVVSADKVNSRGPKVALHPSWMLAERALGKLASVAKAIDYLLPRWSAFIRFLEDGSVFLSNKAAERALRGLALGRKS